MSGPGRVLLTRVGDTASFIKFEGISDNRSNKRVNLYLERDKFLYRLPNVGQTIAGIVSIEDKEGGIVQEDNYQDKLKLYNMRYAMEKDQLAKLLDGETTISILKQILAELKSVRKGKRNSIQKQRRSRSKKRSAGK